jgi:glyoxalase family protein
MTTHTTGIHHLTAIAGDAQRNVEFYSRVLGLRLVKRTVNFDDPGTYHLYYGDESGTPGSILTFFPWPGAHRGRQGTGQAAVTALAILPFSLSFWIERLITHGVPFEGPMRRFDERVLSLKDPDGLALELVAHEGAARRGYWGGGPVPAEHAVRGLHTVTLWTDDLEPTARFLTGVLGFRAVGSEESRHRFTTGDGGPGTLVDVRAAPGFWRGLVGVGSVHHVAWRVPSDEAQQAARAEIARAGVGITPVLDRQYFHSVYFHEPGGVLFEIATDPPGFTVDEPLEALGETLKLPPWLEEQRPRIEAALPALHASTLTTMEER